MHSENVYSDLQVVYSFRLADIMQPTWSYRIWIEWLANGTRTVVYILANPISYVLRSLSYPPTRPVGFLYYTHKSPHTRV